MSLSTDLNSREHFHDDFISIELNTHFQQKRSIQNMSNVNDILFSFFNFDMLSI